MPSHAARPGEDTGRFGHDSRRILVLLRALSVGEPQPVVVRVDDEHRAGAARRVFRRLGRLDPSFGDLSIKRGRVIQDDIACTSRLAVPGALREQRSYAAATHFREHREAQLKTDGSTGSRTLVLQCKRPGSGHSLPCGAVA